MKIRSFSPVVSSIGSPVLHFRFIQCRHKKNVMISRLYPTKESSYRCRAIIACHLWGCVFPHGSRGQYCALETLPKKRRVSTCAIYSRLGSQLKPIVWLHRRGRSRNCFSPALFKPHFQIVRFAYVGRRRFSCRTCAFIDGAVFFSTHLLDFLLEKTPGALVVHQLVVTQVL